MNRLLLQSKIADTDWECYGNFDTFSLLCKKRCALRLGCIITREKMARMELLNEWEFDESVPLKVQ